MSDPAILFVKPKAISADDKKTLADAGVIVVEVRDVNDVKFVRPHSDLSSTALLTAAARAINSVGDGSFASETKKVFAKAVCEAIIAAGAKSQ